MCKLCTSYKVKAYKVAAEAGELHKQLIATNEKLNELQQRYDLMFGLCVQAEAINKARYETLLRTLAEAIVTNTAT